MERKREGERKRQIYGEIKDKNRDREGEKEGWRWRRRGKIIQKVGHKERDSDGEGREIGKDIQQLKLKIGQAQPECLL